MREEQMKRILILAGAICLEAPAKRPKYAMGATIPWDLITALREELEAAGFDMDSCLKRMREIKAEGRP